MKDYWNISDFEVSGYVSMHENGFSWIEFDDAMPSHVKCGNEGSPGFAIVEVKDYCNNPPDAWPIIVGNKIWIQPDMVGDGFWHCMDCNEDIHAKDNNPLRAAMIVYLMMKDEEK